MKNREFKIDKKNDLTDIEINKLKNFNKLKGKYEESVKPLYKSKLYLFRNRKIFIAFFMIMVITFLIILSHSIKAKYPQKPLYELKKIEKRQPKSVSF